jgi:cyclopropane fatty-acyl-phospholipid synthase-like methyltransferase
MKTIEQSTYDKAYFEYGVQSGKSGYQNYSWMPELTIRMAHYLCKDLHIDRTAKVLDYGCAKGYLVKALRLLDINAYGVDISEYAIRKSDSDIEEFLTLIADTDDQAIYKNYSHVIAKDVFEHMNESQIRCVLENWAAQGSKVFFAVPIASVDDGNFVIPQMHNDITHITIKSKEWWEDLVIQSGYDLQFSNYRMHGLKDNWFTNYPKGNVFIYAIPRKK